MFKKGCLSESQPVWNPDRCCSSPWVTVLGRRCRKGILVDVLKTWCLHLRLHLPLQLPRNAGVYPNDLRAGQSKSFQKVGGMEWIDYTIGLSNKDWSMNESIIFGWSVEGIWQVSIACLSWKCVWFLANPMSQNLDQVNEFLVARHCSLKRFLKLISSDLLWPFLKMLA